MNATNEMLLIKTLDPSAHLELSEYTSGWYVSARIEVSNGAFLSSFTEHRDAPETAVHAYLERLQTVSLDEYLVVSYRGERREYRWNGAGFVETTRDRERLA